ncbi:MAG: transporter [Flammeovirgaceae bacterium]|nr:transporter [Flammeovirgaceae bacterium]MDW8288079.1 transporter [Flammeovirgaceae bacterium]
MSDVEYQVLDELYFVISFEKLKENTGLSEEELKNCLYQMLEKGWIKCFKDKEAREIATDIDFENKYAQYQYLATKKGLLAHNSF